MFHLVILDYLLLHHATETLMRRLSPLPFVTILLCGIFACHESPTTSIAPPTASVPTGTLKGGITVRDQNLDPATDASGVTVTFEGSGYSTFTDSEGLWSMDSLPSGTYDITYSKQGYGTIRQFGYQFVGGGTAYMTGWHFEVFPETQVTISAVEPVLIDSAQSETGREQLRLNITPTVTATQQKHSAVFIMISRTASSSIDNRAGAWTNENSLLVNTSSGLNLSIAEIRSTCGFQPGDTAYFTVYATAGRYADPVTRRQEYPSHSAATTTTLVMP